MVFPACALALVFVSVLLVNRNCFQLQPSKKFHLNFTPPRLQSVKRAFLSMTSSILHLLPENNTNAPPPSLTQQQQQKHPSKRGKKTKQPKRSMTIGEGMDQRFPFDDPRMINVKLLSNATAAAAAAGSSSSSSSSFFEENATMTCAIYAAAENMKLIHQLSAFPTNHVKQLAEQVLDDRKIATKGSIAPNNVTAGGLFADFMENNFPVQWLFFTIIE